MFNWSSNNTTNISSDSFNKSENNESLSSEAISQKEKYDDTRKRIDLTDPKAYAHYLQITPTEDDDPHSLSGSPEIIYSRTKEDKEHNQESRPSEKTATQKSINVGPHNGSSPVSPFEEMLGEINSFGSNGPPGLSSPSADSGIAVMVGSTSSSTEDVMPEHLPASNSARINGNGNFHVSERDKIEWQNELEKIEEEIKTLRQVLQVKIRRSSELKRQLGITPLLELQTTLKTIQESDAYQKTSITLKSAGQKTGVALTTAGTSVKTKFGEIKKSPSFQSFQERMNTTYNKLAGKSQRYSRMRTSQSEHNFGDIGGARRPYSLDVDDQFQSASVPTTPTM